MRIIGVVEQLRSGELGIVQPPFDPALRPPHPHSNLAHRVPLGELQPQHFTFDRRQRAQDLARNTSCTSVSASSAGTPNFITAYR